MVSQEIRLSQSPYAKFGDLSDFFDAVLYSGYPRTNRNEKADIDRDGSVWVTGFPNYHFMDDILESDEDFDKKSIFSPSIQKRFENLLDISGNVPPPPDYSPFQELVHFMKRQGMNLFDWQKMDEIVTGIEILIERGYWPFKLPGGGILIGYSEEWKQIVDAHRTIPYDYAIFWSFV
jgi:hypothetical protein